MSDRQHVIGLDLSLTATGIVSSAGWIEVTGRAGKKTDGYPERMAKLDVIVADVVNFITPATTQLAVIEGPIYSRADPSFFDRAHLWWEVYRFLRRAGVPVAVPTPNHLKIYATGKGNVPKTAVVYEVGRRWQMYDTGGNDNACDAVVLAAMGLDWLDRPLCPMPRTHRRALDMVTWPDLTHNSKPFDVAIKQAADELAALSQAVT
jgi:Holliday junction resolvasome RuvABC endonuclease subunit